MSKILFVCLGNICRSPAGAAILNQMIENHPQKDRFVIDSCGLGGWHIGQLPDPRMLKALEARGISVSTKAQKFREVFFHDFDYILAADLDIYHQLLSMAKDENKKKRVYMMTHFSPGLKGKEIPDPYWGDDKDFNHVLDLLEIACNDLLNHLSPDIKS